LPTGPWDLAFEASVLACALGRARRPVGRANGYHTPTPADQPVTPLAFGWLRAPALGESAAGSSPALAAPRAPSARFIVLPRAPKRPGTLASA